MTENAMIAQVESLPDLIRSEFKDLDARARTVLTHDELLSTKRVVITGCGDSHMAGVATELAFEQIAGIPTEPMRAMTAARYAAPYLPQMFPLNPLVLGISVSGTVTRTREAVKLAGERGARTIAITGNPDSPLAGVAQKILDCRIPDFAWAPGVRSYRISLLALLLLAIRLGEVNERYSQGDANAMREELKNTADAIEATIEAVNDRTRELAEQFAEYGNFVFVGDGPNFATAMFGAAKVIEAAGKHAMGQDTEEWAHLQYFTSIDPNTPTFVISPGYRGHNRMAEVVDPMKRVRRSIVAVVPDGDEVIAPDADYVLPVAGSVREAFTPMVYPIASELFAAHLSDVIGEPFFRTENDDYDEGNDIRVSAVVESLADLEG